ncbi:hypothetical protein [Streptomyces reniochalinae]|uniref:Uncharacterized protein n=1 Tax=Streptomyces reniochalinae TaxID=2250578 RepID=A0A367EGX6_9ACTN|nr:hypothetical protein [Streptomyces reniochalinae]RCG16962.1 hypothetical protein DQ392_17950 [Streptomyces reniochalinae]
MLNVTRETKATMNGAVGRVIGWHNDKEVSHLSLAIPGDRAKLTPAQAKALAKWLNETADAITGAEVTARAKVLRDRMSAYGVPRW